MKRKNTNVEIRITEPILTLDSLRNEFERLHGLYPDFQRKELIVYDNYFLSAVGKDDVRNVKNRQASYEKTHRVILALQKLIDARESNGKSLNTLMKRHKMQYV